MRIELFHVPGCRKCAEAREGLKAAAADAIPGLVWRELNAIDELDYAVELGVTGLPAIAVDGELLFASLPTPRQLRDALTRRAGTAA